MFSLILKQTNWSVLGAVFGFLVGFFLKIYLIDIVGLESWGKYVIAQTFSSFVETILSIGIPFVIIKFIPTFIDVNHEKASRIANIFIKYSLFVGGLFLIVIYFSSDYINFFLYDDIDDLSLILFFMSIHVPISMLFGVIVSLYRSVLKIKEIVLYGTFITVSLRAILTFIIFQFSNEIIHFILLEIFTQILVLSVLLYLFNKKEFSLFVNSDIKEVSNDDKMISYGKKMFYNSIILFISGWVLSFIVSIKLPLSDTGAYNILTTIAGLSVFLLINLNKVFAPAISKLYHQEKYKELDFLYKKTTLLVNFLSIPLLILIAAFSNNILSLYSLEMLNYEKYLYFLLIGSMISISSGSSGVFMIMAGLEKKELMLQTIKVILITILSFFLIPIYGLIAVVSLFVFSSLIINIAQLIFIKRELGISPFSTDLLKLIFISYICMFFAITHESDFNILHFVIMPLVVYLFFYLLIFKSISNLVKELK